MRLHLQNTPARVGNVDINAVSKVTELDSGLVIEADKYETLQDGSSRLAISQMSIVEIEKQLAIIVPCMNEEQSILQGVLHGIPHHCLIILVSNSNADNFQAERTLLSRFCSQTRRNGVAVHQQDPGLAHAFVIAGMPQITTTHANSALETGTGQTHIRNGKGEAMMIGTAFAKLAEKAFVGFIDADNFIPGAVHEYCEIFAAGLHHALRNSTTDSSKDNPPLAMVRLKWKSKPKVVDGKLVAQESGRCSRVVNEWMNCLLNSASGNEDYGDLIQTANAGEHAMSIDLALKLHFATGYAVEPFQLINAWERSDVLPPTTPPGTPPQGNHSFRIRSQSSPIQEKIKILQIETMNPHIHDFGKGEEHVLKMQAQGLSTIYHSKLVSQKLKDRLRDYMSTELRAIVGKDGIPQEACVYPSMNVMDFDIFEKEMTARTEFVHFT